MKLTNKFYGYPVLTPYSDDYTGAFTAQVNVLIDQEKNVLRFKVITDILNEDLLGLIESKEASFCIHLEESKTCFRKALLFNEKSFEFTLDYALVKDAIEVNTFIITNTAIDNFSPQKIHTFYEGVTINYGPHQIIGATLTETIQVTKKSDEIKDASSIFAIISDKEAKDKIVKVELTEERIVIKLESEDFLLYGRLLRQNELKNRHKDILLSNIVMPVIIDVFQQIRESEEGIYDDKIWYRSIEAALLEKNISFNDEIRDRNFNAYLLAQIIFEDILSKSLNQIRQLTEEVAV